MALCVALRTLVVNTWNRAVQMCKAGWYIANRGHLTDIGVYGML